MDLHEVIPLGFTRRGTKVHILRVDGGWIYTHILDDSNSTSTFVPCTDEFNKATTDRT